MSYLYRYMLGDILNDYDERIYRLYQTFHLSQTICLPFFWSCI